MFTNPMCYKVTNQPHTRTRRRVFLSWAGHSERIRRLTRAAYLVSVRRSHTVARRAWSAWSMEQMHASSKV